MVASKWVSMLAWVVGFLAMTTPCVDARRQAPAADSKHVEIEPARVPAWVVESARQSVPGLQLAKASRSNGVEGLSYRLQAKAGGRVVELVVSARELLAPPGAEALARLRLAEACAALLEAEGEAALRDVYSTETRRRLVDALESTLKRSALAEAMLAEERVAIGERDERAPIAADVEAALAEARLHELRILWLEWWLDGSGRFDLQTARHRALVVANGLDHLVQGCDALVYASAFARASGEVEDARALLDIAAGLRDCWDPDASGRWNLPSQARDTLVMVLLHQLDMRRASEPQAVLRGLEDFEARVVGAEAAPAWPAVLGVVSEACRSSGDDAAAARLEARLAALGGRAPAIAVEPRRSAGTPIAWMPRASSELARLPRPLPAPAANGPYGARRPIASAWSSAPGEAASDATGAIDAGLQWLARHQASDGSWTYGRLRSICDEESSCVDPRSVVTDNYTSGLTGLALLAFLANGHDARSKARALDARPGEGRSFGQVVEAGLSWLLARQDRRGRVSGDRPFMYNEALAACALIEAHGMRAGSVAKAKAQAAVDFLVSAQRPAPDGKGMWGWRYDARQHAQELVANREAVKDLLHDADTSATAWCILALHSARLAGLSVPEEALQGGMAWIEHATGEDGLVGYVDPRLAGTPVSGAGDHYAYHVSAMSALAMCVRMCVEPDQQGGFLASATRQLVKDPPTAGASKSDTGERLSVDYYYWHWGTLALWHHDGIGTEADRGRAWAAWSPALLRALRSLQASGASCRRGGWIVPDRWGASYGGPLYQTAMAVLALSTPHRYPRFLPPR